MTTTTQPRASGPQASSHNGVHPMEGDPPIRSLNIAELRDRAEKMTNGLNSLRAQRGPLAKQLEDVDQGIHRTEGALVMLQTLIQELDPNPNGLPAGLGG